MTFRLAPIAPVICCSLMACSSAPEHDVGFSRQSAALSDEFLPSGTETLSRMRDVYSTCSSYADTCTVSVSMASSGEPIPLWTEGTLTTRFVRGTALRADASVGLKGQASVGSYILHSTEVHHTVVMSMGSRRAPARHDYKSLEHSVQATNGATGLWGAPVQYVASLLLPDNFAASALAQLGHPVTEALEPLGDGWCLRVHGETPSKTAITLWVDRDSWLLRRLSRDDSLDDIHLRTTIEFHGAVGVDVAPSELAPP